MRHPVARILAVVFVIAACALAASAHAAGEQEAKAATVRVDNFSFVPAELHVARGTEVTWVNADDVPHVVRTEDGSIKSPALDTDDTFSYTFDKAGTYRYFCSLHPKMRGTIVVE